VAAGRRCYGSGHFGSAPPVSGTPLGLRDYRLDDARAGRGPQRVHAGTLPRSTHLPGVDSSSPSTDPLETAEGRKASLRLASRALQVLESCPPCPVCQRLDEAESRAIILLLALLQEGRHEAALERGHGLCMPHFRRAMAEAGQEERQRLIRLERAKIAALEWELDEARRKGVWSSRPEARGEEQRAWIRALRRFATV